MASRSPIQSLRRSDPTVQPAAKPDANPSVPLRRQPDFQSALIRLCIWLFMVLFIGIGAWTGHYNLNIPLYSVLFAVYLVIFVAIFLSVLQRPGWRARRHFTLVADLSATCLVIYMSGDPLSPFVVIYVWCFVTYGVRYGSPFLTEASILSMIGYAIVATILGGWRDSAQEILFLLGMFAILPQYQHSLLRRLRQAREDAEAARNEAERANQAKGQFLANMSHEIRTPMNGVTTMTELLLGTKLSEEQREYAQHVLDSSHSLLGVLNDVLDFSKVESGAVPIEKAAFPIERLCEDALNLVRPVAEKKRLELRLKIDPALPRCVVGDARHIRQVLVNLVGNAVKFTEQGHIELRAAPCRFGDCDGNGVRFSVEDTGIGIAATDHERLFQRFSQVDGSFGRRVSGSGLGLAICRALAQAMGGTIGLESEPGRGSCFWVELKLPPGEVEEAETAPRIETTPARPFHILLVDDDRISRIAGKVLLEREGHLVRAAQSGREALEEIANGDYDVVLMDVHMPEMDGLETTRKIRSGQLDAKRDIPIIGVTASVLRAEQTHFLAAGMNEVVGKPLDTEALSRVIAGICGGSEPLQSST